jgi:predicted enzyme related to lactoylglutathione lyase
MPNPFVHVELNSTDLRRAKTFYGKLFDWKLQDMSMPSPVGTYTMIDVGKGTGGGMLKQLMPDSPSAWMPYVLVDDIEAATAKAEKLGAKICKGVTDLGMGRLSIFEDPTGAIMGLWQPAPKRRAAAKTRASAKRSGASKRRTSRR